MRRRDVLKGLTASFSLAGAFVFSTATTETATSAMGMVRRHIRRTLSPILSRELTPETIGRRYLSLYPEEADVDRLWTALVGSSAPLHKEKLETRFAHLRQHEFEDGDIAIVDGWVLARSEARACAFLVLV